VFLELRNNPRLLLRPPLVGPLLHHLRLLLVVVQVLVLVVVPVVLVVVVVVFSSLVICWEACWGTDREVEAVISNGSEVTPNLIRLER